MASPGRYFGVAKGGVMQTTKNGTPMISVTVEITHRLDGGEWQEMEHEIARVPVFLSEKAWDIAQKKLKLMGFKGDFEKPAFDCPSGTQFDAIPNGQYVNWDVADWNDSARESTAPAKAEIMKLTARWKSDNTRNAVPATPPTVPTPAPQQVTDTVEEEEDFPWAKK